MTDDLETSMTTLSTKSSDEYFTCQCNPPFETERKPGSFYAHRIPIDCMTAEDWQRLAREKQTRAKTVYVVSVVGDEDCGWPNDGAIGVFENRTPAWRLAMDRAEEINEKHSADDLNMEENRVRLERADIYVTEMEVG